MWINKTKLTLFFLFGCVLLSNKEVLAKKNFSGLKSVNSLKSNSKSLSKVDLADLRNSVYSIEPLDVLSTKRIWLELHLQEKVNAAFVIPGNEIVRHIIQGVKDEKIIPYKDEACTKRLSVNDFLFNMRDPSLVIDDNSKDSNSKIVSNIDSYNRTIEENLLFSPKAISKMRFVVDVVLDNVRSEPLLKVMNVVLVIPADRFADEIEQDVAAFNFVDLQKYFDSIPAESSWVNIDNRTDCLQFSKLFNMYHMWVPQSYFLKDDKIELYGGADDKFLDLRKTRLMNDIEHIWVY